ERGLCSDALETRLQALESQGKTTLLLADEAGVLAVAAVADTVRGSSRPAVAELAAMGVEVVMLTGDNPQTARAIAGQVGIRAAHGGLLPQDKADLVAELGSRHGRIGMVGDGINDAPA